MKKWIPIIVAVVLFACFFRFDPIGGNSGYTRFYDRWTHTIVTCDNNENPWMDGRRKSR